MLDLICQSMKMPPRELSIALHRCIDHASLHAVHMMLWSAQRLRPHARVALRHLATQQNGSANSNASGADQAARERPTASARIRQSRAMAEIGGGLFERSSEVQDNGALMDATEQHADDVLQRSARVPSFGGNKVDNELGKGTEQDPGTGFFEKARDQSGDKYGRLSSAPATDRRAVKGKASDAAWAAWTQLQRDTRDNDRPLSPGLQRDRTVLAAAWKRARAKANAVGDEDDVGDSYGRGDGSGGSSDGSDSSDHANRGRGGKTDAETLRRRLKDFEKFRWVTDGASADTQAATDSARCESRSYGQEEYVWSRDRKPRHAWARGMGSGPGPGGRSDGDSKGGAGGRGGRGSTGGRGGTGGTGGTGGRGGSGDASGGGRGAHDAYDDGSGHGRRSLDLSNTYVKGGYTSPKVYLIGDEGASLLAATLSTNEELERLSLQFNGIGNEGAANIAAALRANNTLQTLVLADNVIGDDGAEAIADALCGGDACGSRVPVVDAASSTEQDHTAAQIQPARVGATGSTSALRELDLAMNQISDCGAAALARALQPGGSHALRGLNLRNNRIGVKGARHIAQALEMAATTDPSFNIESSWRRWLRRDILTGATRDSNDLIGDADGASSSSNNFGMRLVSLDLSGNKIGDSGAEALAKMLRACAARGTLTLSALHLAHCDIGPKGATALARAVCGDNTDEDSNGSDGSSRAHSVRHGSMWTLSPDALRDGCPSLLKLTLTGNRVPIEVQRALNMRLARNRAAPQWVRDGTLQVLCHGAGVGVGSGDDCGRDGASERDNDGQGWLLDLCGQDVGDEGVHLLANALADGAKQGTALPLQWLHLGDCGVGDDGASALAAVVAVCPSLIGIDLCTNMVGDDGAVALADALVSHGCQDTAVTGSSDNGTRAESGGLRYLSCRDNRLSDAGARALADAIGHATASTARVLDLGHNAIGVDGCAALGVAIGTPNCALQALCLDNNYVGDEGAGRLASGLRNNSTLRSLGLRLNNVGDMGCFLLGAALRANSACAMRSLDVRGNVIDQGVQSMLDEELAATRLRRQQQ